ncbi:thiolase family protein [bacterium]|nr:thiolase family protein [bacterium]
MIHPWNSKKQSHRVAIVSAARTPFAKAGTQLKDCTAVHLGVTAAREALARYGASVDTIDEVVFGNAGTPANAANISRVIALRAGVPENVSAFTVHRNCASAMEAVAQGCTKIGAGLAETMLVGGTESMTNLPLIFNKHMTEFFTQLNQSRTVGAKAGTMATFRPDMLTPVVSVIEGLTDPISGMNMGQTAEVLARDFGITRADQDQFALRSHQRAVDAQKNNRLTDEIIPTMLEPKFTEVFAQDSGPREKQSLEQLGKLRPFFDRENGTVTPGNACPITDGAGAMVLMNEARAKAEGREILGTISGYAFTGCDPKRMGMGPIFSTSKLLKELGLSMQDIELVELNEAFAAQVIANQRAWNSKTYAQEKLGRTEALGELPDDKLNVNGGAIALGHPVGTTGVRIIMTALFEMRRRGLHRGLATLCIGGGQGAAFVLERN